MKLTISIDSHNAALVEEDAGQELQRILTDAAETIPTYLEPGTTTARGLFDINGNRVGSWTLEA